MSELRSRISDQTPTLSERLRKYGKRAAGGLGVAAISTAIGLGAAHGEDEIKGHAIVPDTTHSQEHPAPVDQHQPHELPPLSIEDEGEAPSTTSETDAKTTVEKQTSETLSLDEAAKNADNFGYDFAKEAISLLGDEQVTTEYLTMDSGEQKPEYTLSSVETSDSKANSLSAKLIPNDNNEYQLFVTSEEYDTDEGLTERMAWSATLSKKIQSEVGNLVTANTYKDILGDKKQLYTIQYSFSDGANTHTVGYEQGIPLFFTDAAGQAPLPDERSDEAASALTNKDGVMSKTKNGLFKAFK